MKFSFSERIKAKKLRKRFPQMKTEPNVALVGNLDHLSTGKNLMIQRNVVIHLGGFKWDGHRGSLKIGDNGVISYGTVIFAAGPFGIEIGSNFECGPNCGIFASQSDYNNKGSHIFKKVTIGDDVVLYHNVTIIPGVIIGDGAVIAAGAVVTQDVPPYSMYGGIPAKFIKSIR